MRQRLNPCLVLVGSMLAAPVHAQAPNADQPIVVTGESLEKARSESFSYVRELGIARGEQQAARWLTPICPKVVGIAEPQAAEAQKRILAIIRNVRAPLASAGCKANFVVALTPDPKAFMNLVARRDPSKLKVSPRRADREFLFGDAAARWWYDTSIKSRDSVPAQTDTGPHVAAANWAAPGTTTTSGAEVPGTADTAASNQYSASLISTPTVRAISAATVVIDVAEAQRLTLPAVIDFAALVGLAEIRPHAAPGNSILALFETASTIREMSNRDYAFLTGLYRIRMDREAPLQRTALVNQMTGDRRASRPVSE